MKAPFTTPAPFLIASIATAALLAAPSHAAQKPTYSPITLENEIEYRLRLHGTIRMVGRPEFAACARAVEDSPLHVPVILAGQYSRMDTSRLDRFLPRLIVDGRRVVDPQFEIMPLGLLGSYVAVVPVMGCLCVEVEFTIQKFKTVGSANVDEAALAQYGWPANWPQGQSREVQTALEPQMYVESDHPEIVALMNRWTRGEGHSVPPHLLGKELARKVVQHFQPSGRGVFMNADGEMTGINVRGAMAARRTGQGPAHDGVCLFVAVCRAAGLPARPVIGVDVNSRTRELISWAEYYVPEAGWVAVDFRRMHRAPGRLRNLEAEWPGLGTNKDLRNLIPIAYHYHVPSIHRSEQSVRVPLLWAWHPVPEWMDTRQTLRIELDRAPRTSERHR